MKKYIAIVFAALLFGLGSITSTTTTVQAAPPLCALDGDADGDGVPDYDDVSIDDSCLLSSTGEEDCVTGEGDGYRDCDDSNLPD